MTGLVTGASRGIGRAVAHALAQRGLRLVLQAQHNRGALEQLCAELPGGPHVPLLADLSQPAAVSALWAQAAGALGRIDVLVNNAGIYRLHPPLEVELADWQAAWRETLAVNLQAPADLSFLAGRAMALAGGGRIINISSRGAFRGEPQAPAYGAAKAGLNALSQSLARAWAPHQVWVFVVAPGWVETDMAADHLQGPRGAEILAQQPSGRVASPAEIAAVVAFCASDAPASMTGAILDVNGASYLRT